jgi:predicted DCC family thiol-disulfide oxidoreductase YuxK
VMLSLGGLWKLLAYLFLCVPKKIRDFVYDFFAGIRRRIFAKPKEACPIVPQEMRKFFYD